MQTPIPRRPQAADLSPTGMNTMVRANFHQADMLADSDTHEAQDFDLSKTTHKTELSVRNSPLRAMVMPMAKTEADLSTNTPAFELSEAVPIPKSKDQAMDMSIAVPRLESFTCQKSILQYRLMSDSEFTRGNWNLNFRKTIRGIGFWISINPELSRGNDLGLGISEK